MNNADGVTNSTYQKTGHKLVYVELNINKFHFVHPPSFLKMVTIIAPEASEPLTLCKKMLNVYLVLYL